MPIIYIARHGKTEYNEQKRLQGWIDTPLNEKGIANARTVAFKLRDKNVAKIYSSDLGRAFTTAYLIAQEIGYKSSIILTNDIREVSFGDLSGMPIAEAEEQYPSLQLDTDYTPPKGESLATMQNRVVKFIGKLQDEEPVLLITHDSVINAIYAAYKGIDLGTYNVDHYNANDFVARILVQDGNIKEFVEITA